MMRQVRLRQELEAAVAHLGGMAEPILEVVAKGIEVQTYAAMRGWEKRMTVGFLAGALNMLADFYDAADSGQHRRPVSHKMCDRRH
jgi:hypothetical protein